jgi:gliding motility-associated transport system permease protein
MLSLVVKEVNGFLNSIIGYVATLVFLITISLFLWVFPDTNFNILDSGYAGLDGLFAITPWMYMFLVPAVTMRLFSEERKSGTIELLLTRPLTEFQIVGAKYAAGVILVLISLLPTLVYYYSVYNLATPVGNIDTGAVWGSYIGLMFLGSGFVAIGLFASSITDNQVVAFIIAMFLCFLCFMGFESASEALAPGLFSNILYNTGINAHYLSMSRGVVDTRDVVYFVSLVALFLFLTRTVLESRKW